MSAYGDERDFPGRDGTSMLSPWLHAGELSPRQIWAAVQAEARGSGVFPPSRGAGVFLSEVGWREFGYHLLYHFPRTPASPLREEFARFPWADDPGGRKLRAWQRGRTGYPIVDAGMRQLWHTGWMHNRVRMIVASFLVKHLRLPWQRGAEWFWDTLVDADLASNTLGWQWSAGCGADAAPYFRIFAPVLQGRKFDPDGDYVRRWVPELARLPLEHLHAPWEAPAEALAAAGVRLGETYPRPIVDHATARAEALAALKQLRA
jgi:deoxyribodipyrimidine photo-lyase